MYRIEYKTETPCQIAREELAKHMAEFLASGGKINEIELGATGDKTSPMFNGNIKHAELTRQDRFRRIRDILKAGGTIDDAAEDLKITRRTAQKIANDHGISIKS